MKMKKKLTEKKLDKIWVDEIHNAIEKMEAVCYRLDDTADAFHKTGNGGICSFLTFQAAIIRESSKQIQNAIGQFLSDEIKKGQINIAETFKIILDAGKR